jgi:hypothetical protein
MTPLHPRSIEVLLDLVEVKLSYLEVFDREDAREKACLENARRELTAMLRPRRSAPNAASRAAA